MSKLTYQDKSFLQELAEIPEINKVTDNNMNSIKKAVNENGQYVSATESNGEFTCTLEGSISQNDIVHILFDTNSTASPASLSVDGGNTFLNILDASGNSINASELSGQSVSVKNAGSHFEIETLNSYSSSKAMSYSANYVNGLNTYSTTEKRIGTYADGRPLYRKTITGTLTGGDVTQTIAHNISNIDINTIKTSGSAVSSSNQAWHIPMWFPVSGSSGYIAVRVDATNIYFNCTASYFTGRPFRLDIEYTKTTD